MKSMVGATLGLLLLSACQGSPRPQTGLVQASSEGIAPELLVADDANAAIKGGDQLQILVYREPDLSLNSVTVDPAGNIDVPLIGRTVAAGLSSAELSAKIRNEMSRYVVKPSVTVNVLAFNSRTVTVEGEVKSPGVYPYQSGLTLLSAIAIAKSPTDIARSEMITVIRTTPNGRYIGVFDIEAIRSGRSPDIALQPKDYIVVGRSGRREFWRGFLQTVPLIGLFTRF